MSDGSDNRAISDGTYKEIIVNWLDNTWKSVTAVTVILSALVLGIMTGKYGIDIFGFKLEGRTALVGAIAAFGGIAVYGWRSVVTIWDIAQRMEDPQEVFLRMRTSSWPLNPFYMIEMNTRNVASTVNFLCIHSLGVFLQWSFLLYEIKTGIFGFADVRSVVLLTLCFIGICIGMIAFGGFEGRIQKLMGLLGYDWSGYRSLLTSLCTLLITISITIYTYLSSNFSCDVPAKFLNFAHAWQSRRSGVPAPRCGRFLPYGWGDAKIVASDARVPTRHKDAHIWY